MIFVCLWYTVFYIKSSCIYLSLCLSVRPPSIYLSICKCISSQTHHASVKWVHLPRIFKFHYFVIGVSYSLVTGSLPSDKHDMLIICVITHSSSKIPYKISFSTVMIWLLYHSCIMMRKVVCALHTLSRYFSSSFCFQTWWIKVAGKKLLNSMCHPWNRWCGEPPQSVNRKENSINELGFSKLFLPSVQGCKFDVSPTVLAG